MTSAITGKACEAWRILEAADLRGLPAPYDVNVSDYAPTKFGLRTVDDLRRWAEAIGAEATSREVNGRVHWNASGELHELPVSVYAVCASAEVAS